MGIPGGRNPALDRPFIAGSVYTVVSAGVQALASRIRPLHPVAEPHVAQVAHDNIPFPPAANTGVDQVQERSKQGLVCTVSVKAEAQYTDDRRQHKQTLGNQSRVVQYFSDVFADLSEPSRLQLNHKQRSISIEPAANADCAVAQGLQKNHEQWSRNVAVQYEFEEP